jgi:sugar phosphate permease
VTIAWGFNNIYFWGWATWMPTYFQTARHFSFRSAGYVYSLTFLVALFVNWGVGYISDRLMKRAPFCTAGWIVSGILFFVGGFLVGNPYWALVWLVVANCFNTPAMMLSQPLLHSIVPEQRIATAVGVSGGVSQLMGAVSPIVIGFIVGASGFGGVIVFLALASFIPGFLTLFLTRKGY